MATTIDPVFYTCKEEKGFLDTLSTDIKENIGVDADLLLDHPSIYIHVWRSKYDIMNGTFSIYVGETNNIVQRTKEHWMAAKLPKIKQTGGNWQHHMIDDVDENGKAVVPTVYYFGHKYFNKSLTLDIENKLIDYCYAMPTAHIYNGRTNPQGGYAGDEYLDDIFSKIWKRLRKKNSELFLQESVIQKSAIYKASPNHKLTEEQKEAKSIILDRIMDALVSNKTEQLIFVEGEAGTGKTVLTSSIFYDMLESDILSQNCYLLVNHGEQLAVYTNMARKMGFEENRVLLPTQFLNQHSVIDKDTDSMVADVNNVADVVFIDEAHLLWNGNNQAYTTKFKSPQLDEIMKRSRITVVMFDENQVLHKNQVYPVEYIEQKRELAKSQGPAPQNGDNNYIVLKNQLRMNCSSETMSWIDDISKNFTVSRLQLDEKFVDKKGYEVKIFDDPEMMHQAIKEKAQKDEYRLSRVVSTMDWEFINRNAPNEEKHYWKINIKKWFIPWNEERYWRDLIGNLSKRQKKKYDMMSWAEKDYSIDEAGSTFTIQGFDLSYVGVILGRAIKYDKVNNKIYIKEDLRSQEYMKGNRTLEDGTVVNVTDLIAKHEIRVLLTRGTCGLYIYACDDNLRKALQESAGMKPEKSVLNRFDSPIKGVPVDPNKIVWANKPK